jgi:crotonobetainyl-CoA:carnitine CoA-transferase CaiB-like acyl-CoA transferase
VEEVEAAAPVALTKCCTSCGVDKPLDAYGKQTGGRFGLHPRCKDCRRATERQRYWSNRDEILAKQKASVRKRARQRWYERMARYVITEEQYRALLEMQDERCAVCHQSVQPLCVDHDHTTGEVRGLLCAPCNFGLGHLQDDIDRLRAAIDYLTEPPARQRR